MPRQNRVTPFGHIIATPERGTYLGNRGVLHDSEGRIRRTWQLRRWIVCVLAFKGRKRQVMTPGHYTELFFLDEATAFAAGHRPCALCRREDYNRFLELTGADGADEIDLRLHAERLDGNGRRLHRASVTELPDGAFVLRSDEPWLVLGGELLRWTPAGYTDRRAAEGTAEAITPPTLMQVLRSNWEPAVPLLHPTATRRG